MIEKTLADELTKIACEQLSAGLRAKSDRMDKVLKMLNLYNLKTIDVTSQESGASSVMNIPFPIMSGHIDAYYSKVDEPPQVDFKIPNRKSLSERVKAAWLQDISSTRSGWKKKDRAEKKAALISGRGIAKVYASSIGNKYTPHYDVVDFFSFVCDPTHGDLEEGNYHGDTSVFVTHSTLEKRAKLGIYDAEQVEKIVFSKEGEEDDQDVQKNKFDRLSALGIDVSTASFAGQKGAMLTEWIMRHDDEMYYLLFDPKTANWVRADKLVNVFKNGKTPYVSWAVNYDPFCFWTKGVSDDIYPLAEAMRFVLNNALENEKRRARPMRTVEGGTFEDVTEIQDYIPDNVIVSKAGKNPNVVTLSTPDASVSINIAEFLDGMIRNKTGVMDQGGMAEDPKVGVYYGQLQQQADRIGSINKEYNESYAHKGYRYFWGLKEHLTRDKQVEMQGKEGIILSMLSKVDFKDVDDVDDVIVSGGFKEQEASAVETKMKSEAINEVVRTYPDKVNPTWYVRTKLKLAGFDEDAIAEALDPKLSEDHEQFERADEAIKAVLLGQNSEMFQGAESAFISRILDFARKELDWVIVDAYGNETGDIDKERKSQYDRLLKYANAHQKIVMENMVRKAKKDSMMEAGAQTAAGGEKPPVASQAETPDILEKMQMAQPNEALMSVPGTPSGTASRSQKLSSIVR